MAAVAVSVACGGTVSEATQRLLECIELFDEMRPGEERMIGEVLELAGYFAHRVELDEADTEIAKALRAALKAAGPEAPSGWVNSVHRSMTTGDLRRAFLLIEARGNRVAPADPQVFWTHMANAARLLGDAEAAQRCHDRLPD